VEVGFAYADNSAYDKKEARLSDALGFATNFYRRYPASGYLGEVKKLEEQKVIKNFHFLPLQPSF
jgi:outer membrane protein assembly factor BamD